MESWKDIKGYEGLYAISDLGRLKYYAKYKGRGRKVYSPGGFMTPISNGKGYLGVALCKDGVKKRAYVHILTAQHFKPNPYNLPEVNHVDGDKSNCAATNLEWVTRLENEKHAWENGLKKKGNEHYKSKPIQQLTPEGVFIAQFVNANHQNQFCPFGIRRAARLSKLAYGYKWVFV